MLYCIDNAMFMDYFKATEKSAQAREGRQHRKEKV